ncbi:hypothetical protein NLX62_07745, partial [Mycobacteriaceae bacterium Msp059]|nr:hypothetical protein [Mycobacteriaceae bacterium Msp059]
EPPAYVEQWQDDMRVARSDGARSPAQIARGMERAAQERVRVAAERVAERRHAVDVGRWLDAEDEHLAAIEYWRRVDTEDLHTMPAAPAETKAKPIEAPAETPMERAARELDEALAS